MANQITLGYQKMIFTQYKGSGYASITETNTKDESFYSIQLLADISVSGIISPSLHASIILCASYDKPLESRILTVSCASLNRVRRGTYRCFKDMVLPVQTLKSAMQGKTSDIYIALTDGEGSRVYGYVKLFKYEEPVKEIKDTVYYAKLLDFLTPFDPFATVNTSYSWFMSKRFSDILKVSETLSVHLRNDILRSFYAALRYIPHILFGIYTDGDMAYLILGFRNYPSAVNLHNAARYYGGYMLYYIDILTGELVKAVMKEDS